jgi:hypothetical protein
MAAGSSSERVLGVMAALEPLDPAVARRATAAFLDGIPVESVKYHPDDRESALVVRLGVDVETMARFAARVADVGGGAGGPGDADSIEDGSLRTLGAAIRRTTDVTTWRDAVEGWADADAAIYDGKPRD